MATKKIRIRDSSDNLQRQLDVDDTTTHVFIYDSTDTEVMDIESHASRHADGGADPLPSNSIATAMIEDAAVTSAKVAAKSEYRNAAVTTGVAIGVSGSPATIVSLTITSGYNNLLPLTVKATPSGLGTSETATFHVVAKTAGGSTLTLASKTTAAGSTATETFTIADYDFTLITDADRVTEIDLTAESSATSTSATATGTATGMENYV